MTQYKRLNDPYTKKVNQQILYYVDWRSHFFSNPLLRSIVRLFQVISKWMALKEPFKQGLNLPVSRFNFLLFL